MFLYHSDSIRRRRRDPILERESPYRTRPSTSRLPARVEHGALAVAEATVREIGQVSLAEALDLTVLIAVRLDGNRHQQELTVLREIASAAPKSRP
jgi:hypothetical protein